MKPTAPCLRHERHLLRKDRQARFSCKIDTYTAQPWQASPTARMGLPPSRPSPPTSGTSAASRKSSSRPWVTGRRPSSSSLALSPREINHPRKGRHAAAVPQRRWHMHAPSHPGPAAAVQGRQTATAHRR